MTDKELIRKMAEKVMGWEFILSSPKNPQPNPYDVYVLKRDDNGEVIDLIQCNQWNPLTNLNHTFMVVEVLRKLGWYFASLLGEDGWHVGFNTMRLEPFSGSSANNKSLGHAICMAALKAVENGGEI